MEPIKDNIVVGETRTGIKFKIDKRVADDNRTMYYIRTMRKYKDSTDNQSKVVDAVYSLLEVIFGSGEGLEIFLNEVAYRHDGVADSTSLMEELSDIFEVIGLKNSSSSQT